jgi:microcystin degradation protein MlrC
MRVAIAEISQETDTFTALPTTLEDFEQYGLYFGREILEKQRGVGVLGGFLAAADQEAPRGLEILPVMRACALAGGRLTRETLRSLEESLVSGFREVGAIDGVFLSLHGAAAAEQEDDVEGHLLKVLRDVIGEDVPVIVPLDHHANVTRLMVDCADVLVGHETQPHNTFGTGLKAARTFFDLLTHRISPTVAWQKIPMITPQEQYLTSHGPMNEWFQLAREMERRPGVVSVSTFPMQPWLDVSEAGWSTVVYTDNDPELARTLTAELAEKAWEFREAFWVLESVEPEEAVRRGVNAKKGLVVLSDTGDSVFGGAPGDSTCLLTEMLRQKITCTALLPILDPEVVGAAVKAGKGSVITVEVGGKVDSKFNRPVVVTGKIVDITQGRLQVSVIGLESFDMGRTVLLKVGDIHIVVSERRGIGGNHPIVYRRFGVEPAEAKMVVLKTASNFQHYESMMSELIRVDSPGPTTSHLDKLGWTRIPRPMYPLDTLREWHAKIA